MDAMTVTLCLDQIEEAMKRVKVRIKQGWEGADRIGERLGPDVFVGQLWTPVLWPDEEDPDWHKAAALEEVPSKAKS